jgi:hypothetical protein
MIENQSYYLLCKSRLIDSLIPNSTKLRNLQYIPAQGYLQFQKLRQSVRVSLYCHVIS